MDMPEVNIAALQRRKVLGVPVLYLIGGGVAILGVYAWKARDTSAATVPADETEPATVTEGTELYPALSDGTVIVAPAVTVTEDPNAAITDNVTWLSKGVAYLVAQGESGGTAQLALSNYLDGAQLSYDQGVMRDKIIREYGLPPDPTTPGGTAPQTPARSAIRESIDNAYQLSLGRDASDSEEKYWEDQGATEQSIYGIVAGSVEATDKALRDQIAALYTTILKRPGSRAEIDFWLPIAKDKGMPYVETGIRGSAEAKRVNG